MGKKLMNRIRNLRTTEGLSQEELARGVGVSRQTIISIEKGNYVPSVGLALELARQFRTTVNNLFYWE